MTVWVGLLRGVNVGGGNRLAMADFRASVESLGYTDVATYIQSGNVVFCSEDAESTIADRLAAVVAARHGLSVPVVVRPGHDLARIVARHPFARSGLEPKLLHIAFLDRAPEVGTAPEADQWLPDRWAVDGRELFLAYPGGSARSKMTIEQFERAWGVTGTARNLNTVARLADMVDASS